MMRRGSACFAVFFAAAFSLPASADTLTTVDVLALYTPGAAARYSGDAVTRIHHVVGVANQIYEDSGAGLRLRLVHAEQVAFSDTVTSSEALDALTEPGQALHEQAVALRDAHGADLVTLMRPYASDGYCGVAWLGGRGSQGQLGASDATYALSHVSIDCSDFVLAHEVGHNMGLAHSRRQSPSGGTFMHSLGHGVDFEFTTVMAYETAFGAPKIYKHANPSLTCVGFPCGVDAADPDAGADAVSSLNWVRDQVAAYREAVMPIDPLEPFEPIPPIQGPADPTVAAELRILGPKPKRRRIRSGKVLPIEWAESGVETVDIAYRETWREGSRDFAALEWTSVAEGESAGRFDWTVPELPGRRVRLQLRLTGRDALGNEVASHATRSLRVKRARR